MNDFKKHLLAGVAAAKTAEANKEEIYDVINEVDRQLSEIYESKVHFGICDNITKNPLIALSLGKKRYQGLAISDHKNENAIHLADWYMSENGYPCKITIDGRESFCNDKEELENEISSLLSHVKTGKAILKTLEEFKKSQAKEC